MEHLFWQHEKAVSRNGSAKRTDTIANINWYQLKMLGLIKYDVNTAENFLKNF